MWVWEHFGWGWEGKEKKRKFLPFKDRLTLTSDVEYQYLIVFGKIHMAFRGLGPEITLIQCT